MSTAVFDTNVLASGFVSRAGIPGQLMLIWTYGLFELVLSEHIIDELGQTFEKPYFQKYLSSELIAADLLLLRREATITSITATVEGIATHPEDDLVLATALSGKCEFLVTGDKRLQALGSYQGVTILSPRAFLDLLAKS
jgi:uncharacterized protein